jgi:hypothetical protein
VQANTCKVTGKVEAVELVLEGSTARNGEKDEEKRDCF